MRVLALERLTRRAFGIKVRECLNAVCPEQADRPLDVLLEPLAIGGPRACTNHHGRRAQLGVALQVALDGKTVALPPGRGHLGHQAVHEIGRRGGEGG